MMLKITSIILMFAIIITLLTPSVSAAPVQTELFLPTTKAVIFKDQNINTITSESQMTGTVEFPYFQYASDAVMGGFLQLNENGQNVDFVFFNCNLYPSHTNLTGNPTLIGDDFLKDSKYELVCFRIEKNCSTLTLLEPNKILEGHIVLTIGLKNKTTSDIFYFQQSLDQIDFDAIYEKAVGYTYYCDEPNMKSIMPNVPDSIFKTGPVDKYLDYVHYPYPGNNYYYAYITKKIAGDENRMTDIIMFVVDQDTATENNKTIHNNNVRIVHNTKIIYDADKNTLKYSQTLLGNDQNNLRVNSISIQHSAYQDIGYFKRATWGGYLSGQAPWAKVLINISKVAFGKGYALAFNTIQDFDPEIYSSGFVDYGGSTLAKAVQADFKGIWKVNDHANLTSVSYNLTGMYTYIPFVITRGHWYQRS